MTKVLAIVGLLCGLVAPSSSQLKEREDRLVELPAGMKDEDEDYIETTEYVFNPVQAKRELKVGRFYMKKGSYRAALGRFQEAAKWNPTYAEAFYWAGIANSRLDQHREAIASFERYLALDPEGKESKRATDQIAEMNRLIETLPMAASDDAIEPVKELPR